MTFIDEIHDQHPEIVIRQMGDDSGKILAVPETLRGYLAPAQLIIYEWTPYVVVFPGATLLKTGSVCHLPIAPGIFQFSFDNQLGLTSIQAFDHLGPLCSPIFVEVIAGKFTNPARSVEFLQQTLTDLFARVTASPFAIGSPTERMVRESQAPPNSLFAFHFFRHHGSELIRAIQAILGQPHQRLSTESHLVRPHEARHIDRESMIRMLQAGRTSPSDSLRTSGRQTPLQQLRPERIWQQFSTETLDTPENRFVFAICERMLTTIQTLQRSAWYRQPLVDFANTQRITSVSQQLGMFTRDDRFAPLGPMMVLPVQSRVLQRRSGYREINLLWQLFQRSRQPMFEHLNTAIDLRNIAELYEHWVWFELLDRVQAITGCKPVHLPVTDDFGSPGWKSHTRFGEFGSLHYNRSFQGYSGISLRPDYVWERPDGGMVVMDAKFRMQKPYELLIDNAGESGTGSDQRAKTDDLQKMHTYRDAIDRVEAAVVIYPGNVSVFRTTSRQRINVDIADLLIGGIEGVGAIPLSPIAALLNEE